MPEYIREEESFLYRIQYAPPGYIMIRGSNPQDDQAIACNVMEYSLEPGVPGSKVMYKPTLASYVEDEYAPPLLRLDRCGRLLLKLVAAHPGGCASLAPKVLTVTPRSVWSPSLAGGEARGQIRCLCPVAHDVRA